MLDSMLPEEDKDRLLKRHYVEGIETWKKGDVFEFIEQRELINFIKSHPNVLKMLPEEYQEQKSLGLVDLKGREKPIQLFEVL